jgi:hypothetical protein
MGSFSCLLLLLVLSLQTTAAEKTFIVQNGSVARCNTIEDLNKRAFRISMVEIKNEVQLTLETLLCVKTQNNNMKLMPYALSEPLTFQYEGSSYAYELLSPYLQFTNTEATKQLFKVFIKPNVSLQKITFHKNLLTESNVDLTIMALEIFKINNQIKDQGLSVGGSYRITGLN